MSINTDNSSTLIPYEMPSNLISADSLTVPSLSQSLGRLADKPITWIHGTNSLVLEQMSYTGYTLKATGKLIQDRMVPFTGELFGGGMDFYGSNRKQVSGMDGFRSGAYETAWSYATTKGNQDPTQFDSSLVEGLDKALAAIQTQPSLNTAIRLTIYILQLRQWNEPLYQSCYAEKAVLIKKLVPTLGKDPFLDEINKLRKGIACQVPKEADLTGEKLSQIIEENFGSPADWVDINSDSSSGYRLSPFGYQIKNRLEGYTYLWNKQAILRHIRWSRNSSLYSAIVALKNYKLGLFNSKIKEIEQAFLEVEQEVDLVHENLLKALSNEPLPIQLDEEGRKKWRNIVAFPLLMASCQDLHPSRGYGGFNEAAVEQPLQLGKEIDILATDEDHIEELRKLVQDHLPDSIQVYTNEEIQHLLRESSKS